MENQTVIILALIALIAWLIFGRDQRRPSRQWGYAHGGPYWGPRPEWHGRGGRDWHGRD
jgi:hypothetical protein